MKIKIYKTCLVLSGILSFVFQLQAQLTNQGSMVVSGNNINIAGNLLNESGASLTNEGILTLEGNLTNNSDFVSSPNSEVILSGNVQEINGTSPVIFEKLRLSGSGLKSLMQNCTINNNLDFNSQSLRINNYNLFLLPDATFSNFSQSGHVITNGIGTIIKYSAPLSTDFFFPVGCASDNFSPVVLNYTGEVDSFAVRVEQGVTPSFVNNDYCVQNTFFVDEFNQGGTNATIRLGWNTANEATGFVRENSRIFHLVGSDWVVANDVPGIEDNSPITEWSHYVDGLPGFNPDNNRFIVAGINKPAFINQPQDVTICENQNASFGAEASGDLINYQWQMTIDGVNWINISPEFPFSGTTNDTLSIENATVDFTGNEFQCIASNFSGSDTSQSAIFMVNSNFVIFLGADDTLCYNTGDILSLDAGITGAEYIWNDGTTNQVNSVSADSLGLGSYVYAVTVTDGICSSSDSIHIIVDICSGTNMLSGQPDILIYPNPTKGELNLKFERLSENAILSIQDISGREIVNSHVSKNTIQKQIDLGNLPKGIYTVKIVSSELSWVRRVILQ